MKNQKLPISVAMVVYNEEGSIGRALESCADLVDDIVIVHDGPCTDRSLKIARKYTKNIFVEKHVGAPEPHRPLSFKKAKNNWILQLDADEYLDKDFRRALPKLIKKDVPGYTVNWIEESGDSRFLNMPKEVLFQKNRVYFIGAPCEYIKPVSSKEKLTHASVGLVNSAKASNYSSWKLYIKKYSSFRNIQARIYGSPFSRLKSWNYSKNEWDRNTKLKIDHPLILGILGMNIKYLIEFTKKIIGLETPSSIRSIIRQIWYNTTLYWSVWQIKSKNKNLFKG